MLYWFFWNTSLWGNITYEHWIEEDGGSSAAITQSISYPLNGVTYNTTISIPSRSLDQDLGNANVQFNDQLAWQIPMLPNTYSNFKYTYYQMNMQRE